MSGVECPPIDSNTVWLTDGKMHSINHLCTQSPPCSTTATVRPYYMHAFTNFFCTKFGTTLSTAHPRVSLGAFHRVTNNGYICQIDRENKHEVPYPCPTLVQSRIRDARTIVICFHIKANTHFNQNTIAQAGQRRYSSIQRISIGRCSHHLPDPSSSPARSCTMFFLSRLPTNLQFIS